MQACSTIAHVMATGYGSFKKIGAANQQEAGRLRAMHAQVHSRRRRPMWRAPGDLRLGILQHRQT